MDATENFIEKGVEIMAFDYSKLRGQIRGNYNTQSAFAKEMGFSSASLSAKLNGKVQFTQNEMDKACNLLRIDKAEIASYFFTKNAG